LADPVTLDMVQKGTIPPACEDYIGAWLNGSDEHDAIYMGDGQRQALFCAYSSCHLEIRCQNLVLRGLSNGCAGSV